MCIYSGLRSLAVVENQPLLTPSLDTNRSSPWFENQSKYQKDLIIHRMAIGILTFVGAVWLIAVSLKFIKKKDAILAYPLLVLCPLSALVFNIIGNSISHLGLVPHLNQEDTFKRICQQLHDMTLPTAMDWQKDFGQRKLFKALVRYQIWEKETYYELTDLHRDYQKLLTNLKEITPAENKQYNDLLKRRSLLKLKMIDHLPYKPQIV